MKRSASRVLNRRQFLQRAVPAVVLPVLVPASVLGRSGSVAPGNRITFAAIGVGNRAHDIMRNFLALPDLQFLAVCDCRADRLRSGKEMVDAHYRNQDCRAYADFREVLALADVAEANRMLWREPRAPWRV